jgi:phospholipid/cholesterol/gamma-HCH transport system substrate-binding protein
METRANFVLIGVFTLAAILGSLGFFIWLSAAQLDRQYATYGILFDDVTGLDASGDVLYNGISVGSVIDLRIDEIDPSKVFATVQVDAKTPVTDQTVAQLQSQGVTGVASISLSSAAGRGAALLASAGRTLPIIVSQRSTVQALVEDAPDFLAEGTALLQQLRALTGPENQALVGNILQNLNSTAAQLDQALADFSQISATVNEATAQISLFTDRLETIGGAVEGTLLRSDSALAAVQQAFVSADEVLRTLGPTLARIEGSFTLAEDLLRAQIPDVVAQIAAAVAQTDLAVRDIQTRAGGVIDSFGDTAGLFNARLVELETSLQRADTAFDAVTQAADDFDALVVGDGADLVVAAQALLADAQRATSQIAVVMQDDVPVIVADIRAATAQARLAVDQIAADVSGFSAQLTPMADDAALLIASANDLMARAQVSLTALDQTLTGADGALAAAQSAFAQADGLMQNDLDPLFADLRQSGASIAQAVADVSADVPAITADLRGLIARVDTLVSQAAPGVATFSQSGLPELTRLAAEARNLVDALGGLVRRIDTNPAGFLLNNNVPEYRR